jgi:murein DD-endopeptidase MepM/ murein hydrolase activator NlpD
MRQLWTRAAVIALTAGTLAACETTSAPQYPARDGQPTGAPSRAQSPNFPITQAPAPSSDQPIDTSPQPSEAIRREPIPVEAAPAPSLPEPTVRRTELPPAPAYTPPPAPPKPVVVTTVAGAVVEVPGKPQVRVVESGDALDAIARGFGATRAELIKLNDLEPPYRLKLGQKIKGPAKEGQKAYVVGQGDTMFAIAKRFNVTQAALAEENDLKTGASIRKGQKLLLPDGYKDKGPTKTTVMQAQSGSGSTNLAGASPASRPTETPRATTPASTSSSPFGSSGSTTTTSLSVTGSVVSVTGPRQVYTVKSGDTLTSIAKRFDMSVKEVADGNDLDTDKPLRLGAKIKGPATTSKAYVAQTGDTLTAIAKRFNVSVKALAAENNLKTSAAVKKGQKIVLPDDYKDRGPIRTTTTTPTAPSRTYAEAPTPAPSQPAAVTPSAPIPYKPSNSQPAAPPPSSYPRPTGPVAALPTTPPASTARPIIESSAAPTEAEIIASGRGKFSWPLRGEIISDFGVKGTGQRNDGLNIRAAAGTPVVAAADGEIAYAGNQVPTFGNLVLVKHADGWVTAYAHLGSTSVKMRQQVRKGDQLGAVGATGGVNEPQLHFEMRFAPTVKDKARPVDPGLVLPR